MDCECKYCKEKYISPDAALMKFASDLPLPASITEQIQVIKDSTAEAMQSKEKAKQFLIDAGIFKNAKPLTGKPMEILNKAYTLSKTPTKL